MNQKGAFKLSSFIIALIVASLIITTISLTMGNLASKYTKTYNESELAVYNTLNKTQELTFKLQDKIENKSTSTGVVDLVGGFISNAVDALKIAKGSYSTFETMAEAGTRQLGLPEIFKIALFCIVIIAILFVIISAMIKGDL